MSDASAPARAAGAALGLSISAVERDTGIAKETLRSWERRYNFPQPLRDGSGERLYPLEQMERLRMVRRLLAAGHRPGRVVQLPLTELERLCSEVLTTRSSVEDEAVVMPARLQQLYRWVQEYRPERLQQALEGDVLTLGVPRWLEGILIPLDLRVRQAVTAGELPACTERGFEEQVLALLAALRLRVPSPVEGSASPVVVTAAPPQESRRLAIAAGELLLSLLGCRCLGLGAQVPAWEMVQAVQLHRADVLLLYLGSGQSPAPLTELVRLLRQEVGDGVEIWLGSRVPAVRRRPPPSTRVVHSFSQLHPAISAWRERHTRPEPFRPVWPAEAAAAPEPGWGDPAADSGEQREHPGIAKQG